MHPAFAGLVMHSHSYRRPGLGVLGRALAAVRAAGRRGVVAVVGLGPSGEDVARELSPVVDKAWDGVRWGGRAGGGGAEWRQGSRQRRAGGR